MPRLRPHHSSKSPRGRASANLRGIERTARRRSTSVDSSATEKLYPVHAVLPTLPVADREAFQLGAANDRALADLDRLDAALSDQLIEKCSGDTEVVSRFRDREAQLRVRHITHRATSCWPPVSEARASAVMHAQLRMDRDGHDQWRSPIASGDSGGWYMPVTAQD